MMAFVYLLSSKPHGTLYVRSASDLVRRVWEHKKTKPFPALQPNTASTGLPGSKSTKHWLPQRERQIKEWKRAWKIELIEKDNPHWIDLSPTLSPCGGGFRAADKCVPAFARKRHSKQRRQAFTPTAS